MIFILEAFKILYVFSVPILLSLSFFATYDLELLQIIGSYAIKILTALSILFFILHLKIIQKLKPLALEISCLTSLCTLYLLDLGEFGERSIGLRRAYLLISIIVLLSNYYLISLNQKLRSHFKTSLIVALIPALAFCFFVFWTDFEFKKWNMGFLNVNTAGMTLFTLYVLSIYCFLKKVGMSLFVISSGASFLILATSARASLIATLTLFIALLALRFTKLREIPRITYALLASLSASIVLFITSDLFKKTLKPFNQMIKDYTGQDLHSGRERLWIAILEQIQTHWITGVGAGALPREVTHFNYSTHHHFLQVFFEVGIFGFFLYATLLGGLFFKLCRAKESFKQNVVIAYFFAMMLLQSFEVVILQNHFAFGILFWMMAGYSIASNDLKKLN